jgi:hypothetical protein
LPSLLGPMKITAAVMRAESVKAVLDHLVLPARPPPLSPGRPPPGPPPLADPFTKRLKKQLTIRLDAETLEYFQELSREMSLPHQRLMNMYLRECATTRRRPQWAPSRLAKQADPRTRRTASGGSRR